MQRRFWYLVFIVATGVASFLWGEARARAQAPATDAPKQTIRLEAGSDGRVRLKLEGKETWTVEAKAFDALVGPEGLRLVAQPENVSIQTPNLLSIAREFELLIKLDGSLGFHIRNSFRVKQP